MGTFCLQELDPIEMFHLTIYGLAWSSSVQLQHKMKLIQFTGSLETRPPEKLVMVDMFVNFVFQTGKAYQLCMGHISFPMCNY